MNIYNYNDTNNSNISSIISPIIPYVSPLWEAISYPLFDDLARRISLKAYTEMAKSAIINEVKVDILDNGKNFEKSV